MTSIPRLFSSNRFQLIFLLLVIIAGCYLASVRFFIKDKLDFASFTDVDVSQKKTSVVQADVRTVEIDKREAKVELRIYLADELTFNHRIDTPAEELRLISYSSNEEFIFKPKQPIRKVLITLPLVGTITDYPFDTFQANLSLGFFKKQSEIEQEGIPIVLNMNSPIASYKVEFYDKQVEDFWIDRTYGNVDRLIQVARTKSNRFVSLFIIVFMFAVGIVILVITARTLLYQKEVHIEELIFLAALLIALPAVRNTQPGIPNSGVLSDYLSYFWAVGLTALSFLTLLLYHHFFKKDGRM
ncbi:hypothetical protein LPTSP4_16300 [Leptospira ryugenii]|uniref:DUF4436 domain-containing protein n=1 Tax=Leptospira ryugenii TaxID=1917863 RepID=A0A2P2DZW2_9LEPT|nr:DUF4436 family protein [Leptospira ryugenii]GBF50106.1 hypothetical protein LPTSP4_16300 [Leptospira ryugenii]